MKNINVNISLQVLESGNTLVLFTSDELKPQVLIAHEVKLFWSNKYERFLLRPYLRPKNRMAILISDVFDGSSWKYVGDRGIMLHEGNFLKDSSNCPMPGKLIKGNKLDYCTSVDRALLSSSKTALEVVFKKMFGRSIKQGVLSDDEIVQWTASYEERYRV